ncbi:hypothetical protein GCM10023321_43870 [Pseudonocardia eucalypti]|uniref:Uncharacterized protein n=2 Tax=Pseudonocardia eucalypti TaxID=648755 RepID=A0ABP9QEV9_9PSEU
MRRYVRAGFEALDVLVDGPPWAMRAAIRYRVLDGDKLAYRGTSFVRMSWGRIVEARVLPGRSGRRRARASGRIRRRMTS